MNLNALKTFISEIIREATETSWEKWKDEVDVIFKSIAPKAIPGTREYAEMNMAAKKLQGDTNRPSPREFLSSLSYHKSSVSPRSANEPPKPGTFDGEVYTVKLGFSPVQTFFPIKSVDEETGEETTRRGTKFDMKQDTIQYIWDNIEKKWLRGTQLPRNRPQTPTSPSPASSTSRTPPPAPLRGPRREEPKHEPKVVRRRPSST